MIPIPVREGLTRREFQAGFERASRPVVLRGAIADWPALGWSADSIAARLGDREVSVQVWDRSDYVGFRHEAWPLSRYVAGMRDPATRHRYYLAQQALAGPLAPLAGDVGHPEVVPPVLAFPPCLWLSAAEMPTPLHFDICHGLLASIAGHKRFLFVAPRDAHRLAHPRFPRENWFWSPVDLEAPDLDRFPALRDLEIHECTSAPGDLVFVPSFWRHQVRSLQECVSVSFHWQGLAQRALRAALALVGRPYA